MVDSFMVYNFKYDEWALIGAWAAIRTNTVLVCMKYFTFKCLHLCKKSHSLDSLKLAVMALWSEAYKALLQKKAGNPSKKPKPSRKGKKCMNFDTKSRNSSCMLFPENYHAWMWLLLCMCACAHPFTRVHVFWPQASDKMLRNKSISLAINFNYAHCQIVSKTDVLAVSQHSKLVKCYAG